VWWGGRGTGRVDASRRFWVWVLTVLVRAQRKKARPLEKGERNDPARGSSGPTDFITKDKGTVMKATTSTNLHDEELTCKSSTRWKIDAATVVKRKPSIH